MSDKKQPARRSDYPHFTEVTTRWSDNDSYGHVNNAVYYSYFDAAVNQNLIRRGVLDIGKSRNIGLVVETRCTYFSPLFFPDVINVGLKVVHLGKSSVRYEIGLFRNSSEDAAAVGEFVHVYVDRTTNRPTPIPGDVRSVLEYLLK